MPSADFRWSAPDRGHGHCIYSQNREGIKTIADNILCTKYKGTYSLYAYGSAQADVDNFLVEGNIAFEGGPFLIGSGKPSHHIRVLGNHLYGVLMKIGYNAPENEDGEVRNNVIVQGGIEINRYKKVVNENNLVLRNGAVRPKGALVALRPNKYDTRRANLAVYNWDLAPTVTADTAGFLKDGERFALMNPKEFFGKPVCDGICRKGKIEVPMMRGGETAEFAAFVLLKKPD